MPVCAPRKGSCPGNWWCCDELRLPDRLWSIRIGIALLFFNAKSIAGWAPAAGCFLMILVGIITDLSFFILPTNLLVTLL
jgi:hypothetical protein